MKIDNFITAYVRSRTDMIATTAHHATPMKDWSLQRFTATNAKLNMATTFRPHRTSLLHIAAGLTGILTLGACASTPPDPTANLQEARHAIAVADQAEAGRYAPHELSAARARLAAAAGAVNAQRMVTAQRLANESTADAELATAQTADVKAKSVNMEMKQSTATMIDEMQRSSGVPQ